MLDALRQSRRARRIASALLWTYALMLFAAVVATARGPLGFEVVCAAHSGVRLILAQGPDGDRVHALPQDCPLCGAPGLLPSQPNVPGPAEHVVLRLSQVRIDALHRAHATGAPLPARGPPRAS